MVWWGNVRGKAGKCMKAVKEEMYPLIGRPSSSLPSVYLISDQGDTNIASSLRKTPKSVEVE